MVAGIAAVLGRARTPHAAWRALCLLALVSGCSDRAVATTLGDTTGQGDATTQDDPSTTLVDSGVTQSATSSPTSAADESSSGAVGASESTDDCGFICEPDGGGDQFECSQWDQDCRPGEKCMPYANDGGNSWNATRCFPVDDAPVGPGEPCTVVDSPASGLDDCELGSMCWYYDDETGLGECVAFCEGSEVNPVCTDPATQCSINGEGTLTLCLPGCDPLAQDCDWDQACYPAYDGFQCAPDASGRMGAFGEPCEFLNVCDPGLFCGDPEQVPGCTAPGCCNGFCDLAEADPDATCAGEGQVCVPWFEPGHAPPGLVDLGACALPE